MPAISSEEAKILRADVESVFRTSFQGAQTHLQAALDAINKADNLAVVRESIHAVESAVRDFTGDQSAVLSRALKVLKDQKRLHPALSDAFEKLYAYTSDEKGIRHALVFKDNINVGFEEAIFFVSSCSAFIAFLARSQKKRDVAA
jgi:hypothetical protein